MVWRETGIMDERLRFVVDCLAGEETMSEICAAYGISRKIGYKWLGRYRALGPEGLRDLPRAPLNHGRATALDLVERIVAAKETHPLWGPKKIVARLKRTAPELRWPSASTAGAILARHGLVGARKRPRLRACGNGPWPPAEEPNAVWTGDHKGWFPTGDKRRCEPLTVMDASSRYLLALEATGSTADAEAWPVFERLFEEHGLPDRFRSDNGPPFASAGVAGLTPLAARFVKLGIVLERIAPGKPQQNGRHERFHLTMLPLAKHPQADRTAQGRA
ncbi:helix-turn-helix domain-containing protein, partial [Mesorhizobium opportunistum]